MNYSPARALELLRIGSGIPAASFREGQEDAIRHVVEGRGRLLVVQKTGWGKSFVYFIAARLLREQGSGPAILISPLLALMRNQIRAAERMGVRAATIHSDNQQDWPEIESRLARHEIDLLLISPERLANEHFTGKVLAPIAAQVGLLVIDEAHCISDWGHDFRPHYRLIERIVRTLPPTLRLLATTATANDRVMEDLRSILGPRLEVMRGDLNRPSLLLQTITMPSQAERMAWLAERIPALPGSGIVYTLTVRDARQVAEWLASRGMLAQAYTSDSADRESLEDALLENRIKVMVATTALGMGFDKPDLAFVIHYQTPGSAVAYYQQVGRAGRALEAAYGVLFSGAEDADITDYFINSAFPTREEVRQVLSTLDQEAQGLSIPEILARINLSKGRVEKALFLLSLESPAPIVKDGSRWQLTAAQLSPQFWERAERLTILRRAEQAQMEEYAALRQGHMEFLIHALDGDARGIQPPRLDPLPAGTKPALVQAAIEFLRRTKLVIEPRRLWPTGGMPSLDQKGRISPKFQMEEGRALCAWGDAGWGSLVRQGKYQDGHFSDDLVQACARMIRAWRPQPPIEWVTAVPSLRHPRLVPDFARRLAAELGLPFQESLRKTGHRPEQKTMANSIQQARNVDGSLSVNALAVLPGAVLLVDDMVDSRWTLTLGAYLLREHGGGAVFPLALATTG
ncbi:MAG: RecQ family ATP-dependent DNA helicase [bacterium]|nr:RecQ family ATP-dependent DNA helicase [bacterium]